MTLKYRRQEERRLNKKEKKKTRKERKKLKKLKTEGITESKVRRLTTQFQKLSLVAERSSLLPDSGSSRKMGDKKQEDVGKPEWRWRRECPRFNGMNSEYKSWKGQVEDWLTVYEDEIKYPALEMRMSLFGKAREIAEEIDRDVLKDTGGEKVLLEKLDKVYGKETIMENYGKMKAYFKIERTSDEKMTDYIIRYEKTASECRRAIGREMFEGEAKGFHVMEQANLSEQQKQLVLSACGQGKMDYDMVSKILKRVFESLGKSEETDWWGTEKKEFGGRRGSFGQWRGRGRSSGQGRGKNPLNKEGKVTKCVLCGSEWHWARNCPRNFNNRNKDYVEKEKDSYNKESENNKDKKEVYENVYIGDMSSAEEERWGEIEAILDTGCRSTVCGEL